MIIGLTGFAGHGKSTFASMLNTEIFKTEFKDTPEIAFATPMRKFFLQCIGCNDSVYSDDFKTTLDPKRKEMRIQDVLDPATYMTEERVAHAAEDLIKGFYGKSVTQPQFRHLYNYLYGLPDEEGFNFILQHRTVREAMQLVGTDWARSHWPNIWIDITEDKIYELLRQENKHILVTDCRFVNEAQMLKDTGGIIIRICDSHKDTKDIHISEKPLPDSMVDLEIDNSGSLEDLRKEAVRISELLRKGEI